MLDRQCESLSNVGGMHVVHQLGAEAWHTDLVTGGQRVPDPGIEVAQGADRHPPRPADVTGLQDGGGQAACPGFRGQ